LMLQRFLAGCEESGADIQLVSAGDLNIDPCAGCLRCNLIRRCSLRGDDWENLGRAILESDILAISSPVYFFSFPSELKRIIDRFRSFIQVQITETGLIHTPRAEWAKRFVVFLSMGSPDPGEARHIEETMNFIVRQLGEKNELFIFKGTRLAVAGQVEMPLEKLKPLYDKLRIPEELVSPDFKNNRRLMEDIFSCGKKWGSGKK